MNGTLKLTLLVITGFICFTVMISSVMMLSVKHYAAYQTPLTTVFFFSLAASVFAIIHIIKTNNAWKKNQIKKAVDVWAEWTVEGIEWENFKALYTSDISIKKDTRLYSLIASIIWFLFIALLISVSTKFLTALIIALLTAPVFFGLIYLII